MFDVVIIGAGVSGCAIAEACSRYDLSVAVLEKEEDICSGTSKANSGIIHAGYDAKENTLMAKLNVEGTKMIEEVAERLQIAYKKTGSLVTCIHEDDKGKLKALYDRGITNKVEGLQLIEDKELMKKMEPNLADEVVALLYAPSAGIICPFELTIALAEVACQNEVAFYRNHHVQQIMKIQDGWRIITNKGNFESRIVVNAAGVYADEVHNMVSDEKLKITPRRGEYILLDKEVGNHVRHVVFSLPTKLGKGMLVTPTVHGNLLVGPTAHDIEDKEDTSTSVEGLKEIQLKACLNVKDVPLKHAITSFSGLRALSDDEDFIIEEVQGSEGFIDCAGIASPGLSASVAIGKYVKNIIVTKLNASKKINYIDRRDAIVNPLQLDKEKRMQLIKEKPLYAHIICRCERISEQEIIDAIHRPVGALSLDGIKRRTRAQMGRCQGGFCTSKIMEIIAREGKLNYEDITKNSDESPLVIQRGINYENI